ncbi:fumarylacetoacetate hydrolase family protein [Mesorhizobium sp.]|uniref:fumarylacetoacetate hydrolase family protein n=1 Tax=Mesorhizobium sp. TaxID=1871066 RepID=UPI0025DFA4EC|nr:fumarylacetoacetate hydrolase family protein [Mesorhizobium sp.]
MKFVTYRASVEAAARLGVVVDDLVVNVGALAAAQDKVLPDTMLGLIDAGRAGLDTLRDCLGSAAGRFPAGTATAIGNVKLLAPIPRPRKNIFGIGLNFVEHVAESAKSLDTSKDLPKQPVVFSKPPTTVIGPGDAIEHNKKITQQLDWEVELAVIIGTTARRARKQDALSHVFGYSVMIDVSARDNRRAGQWIFSKGQDTYAPFGPCIVTADEIPDPQVLDLWLTVNGVEKQRSNTRHMLFKVDHLIADISSGITLEPGDIIASGTPEGVGAGRNPQEWMWPGDVVVACVEGIGTLRHPVVDATPEENCRAEAS